MPTLDQAVAARATYDRAIASRTVAVLTALWARLSASDDFTATYRGGTGASLLAAVTAAQRLAASGAATYIAATVDAQGERSDPAGVVAPDVFAGYAADGSPLEGSLYLPVITTKNRIAAGDELDTALASGLARLTKIALGEIGNTARLSDGVTIGLDRTITGYVRRVSSPSCGRCLILAGRFYKRNAGFARHPHCDCFHVPGTRGFTGGKVKEENPRALFEAMTEAEQNASLGKANATAARAGADLSQVVNANRGMRAPGDRYTSEGTTVRGVAGKVLADKSGTRAKATGERYRVANQGRLTPAAILAQYGDDADRFRAALAANGYL